MTPTNPQDIAAALAFLADQGVDTCITRLTYEDPNRIEYTVPGTPRLLTPSIATPYDIHAITDMLAEWLAEHRVYVQRCPSGWFAESMDRFAKSLGQLDCDDNRLAAHLAECREVEG